MPFGWSRPIFALVLGLALAGCPERNPTVAFYAPPAGLTPELGTTLKGSLGDTFFLQSREYRVVWAIDGVPVADAAYRWDQPLLVTANEPHRLSLVYDWINVAGTIDVDFTGKPGSTVVVKSEDVEREAVVRMWLEDASSGQIIGDKHLVWLIYAYSAPIPWIMPPIIFGGGH